MKKYIIMSAVCLVSLTGLTGCSDFLESDNLSTVTPEDQFSSQSGWEQLLNEAYYSMRDIYSSPLLFCTGTDMYTTSQGNSPSTLQTYQYTADNTEVQNLYTNTYASINKANCVLKYSSDEKINDQARFVRAYGYYILTQQFGAVPYIEDYIESASTDYPRTELATVYENIINDLNGIISNGNLDQTSSAADGRGRASILGAKALLSKVYLAAGWDLQTTLTDAAKGTYTVNGTDYFKKAATTAAEVANAIPLTQDFETKWDFDVNEAGNNAETLFAIQYDRATSSDQATGGHSQQHYFGCYMGPANYGLKALKNDLCPTERVYYAYEKGDERYESSFMTTVYAYDGNTDNWSKQGYWAFYNTTDNEKAQLPIAWKFFPWYTEQAEIDDYIIAHASQFVTTGMKYPTKIYHVADQVAYYNFSTNGTISDYGSKAFENAIAASGNVPCIRKFDDKNTTSAVSQSGGDYRDIVVLNASEIYLVAAEAYLMAGDETNALSYLNAVRSRAKANTLNAFSDYKRYDWGLNDVGGYVKVGDTDSYEITLTKLDVILDERMRETVGEYYRWMDLRRTRQLVRYNIAYNNATIASMSGNDGEIKWLRPIPANEIQINSGITSNDQNPGFRTLGNDDEDETAE